MKYRALKEETKTGVSEDPFVILTKSGKKVYKAENNSMEVKNAHNAEPQRYDNQLFFTAPEKDEPKPKRNPVNYTKKAKAVGYRGERIRSYLWRAKKFRIK